MSDLVRFGVNNIQDAPLPEVIERWQACDDAGLEVVGLPDSPIARELHVYMTLCALRTSRISVLSAVTNPLTRDPTITASALLTLNELAPGRIRLGIATGDSAAWGIGLRPARIEDLREYVLAVRGLLRGETVDFRGRELRPSWKGWEPPTEIPVYIACAGPKALRLAAEIADGAIVAYGAMTAETIAEALGGREDLDIWWQTSVTFGTSVEDAMSRSLGVNPAWISMGSWEGKDVPAELRAPLRELTRDIYDLGAVYKTRNRGELLVGRARALGVYDWLVSRAPRIWGTDEDIARRLRQLGSDGLTNWLFYGGSFYGETSRLIELLGAELNAGIT
jgi:alkanesulfonate monooxygenase SsuD/methylene tetrahydromethanopterin reductase-like flavin-dependent oxidoreductase (luciferase family)